MCGQGPPTVPVSSVLLVPFPSHRLSVGAPQSALPSPPHHPQGTFPVNKQSFSRNQAQNNFCRSPRVHQYKCSCSKSGGDVKVKVHFCQLKNLIAKEYTDTCFFFKTICDSLTYRVKKLLLWFSLSWSCTSEMLSLSLLRPAKSVKAL